MNGLAGLLGPMAGKMRQSGMGGQQGPGIDFGMQGRGQPQMSDEEIARIQQMFAQQQQPMPQAGPGPDLGGDSQALQDRLDKLMKSLTWKTKIAETMNNVRGGGRGTRMSSL